MKPTTAKVLAHTAFIIQFASANLPKTTTTANSNIFHNFTIHFSLSLSLHLFRSSHACHLIKQQPEMNIKKRIAENVLSSNERTFIPIRSITSPDHLCGAHLMFVWLSYSFVRYCCVWTMHVLSIRYEFICSRSFTCELTEHIFDGSTAIKWNRLKLNWMAASTINLYL